MVWDSVGEGNQHLRYQIEMVHRRAARFVTGDWRTTSSVTPLIKTLQWQTLEQRRRLSRLIFLHKYCHKAIDITGPIAVRGRGVNINYQAINPRLRCDDSSFAPSTVRDWNVLPRNSQNKHTLNFARMMYFMSMQIYILILILKFAFHFFQLLFCF